MVISSRRAVVESTAKLVMVETLAVQELKGKIKMSALSESELSCARRSAKPQKELLTLFLLSSLRLKSAPIGTPLLGAEILIFFSGLFGLRELPGCRPLAASRSASDAFRVFASLLCEVEEEGSEVWLVEPLIWSR